MKQETLEEAAIDTTKKYINEREKQTAYLEFIEGAKWQAEKMYSEEEVLNILQEFKRYLSFGDEISQSDWFKQFKKK